MRCARFLLTPSSLSHALLQQDESYARPTAIGPYDGPSQRRAHPSAPFPNPSPFTALSSVAMDELYALERQEALRRAQYEARHAEALRRAKTQTRVTIEPYPSRHRLSKSATTSPILRNSLPLNSNTTDDRASCVPTTDSDWQGPSTPDLQDAVRIGSKRRLSGPAWTAPLTHQHETTPSLVQSRSSGHLVETMRTGSMHLSHHPHPYHQPPHYHHRGPERNGASAGPILDESPSPISSDSEPLPVQDHAFASQTSPRIFHLGGRSYGHPGAHSVDHSPPHYSSAMRTTSSDFAFTPSTSPFLGPLRTLNIHSANPSRAPSPILLPPPSSSSSTRNFDINSRDGVYEEPTVHSRAGSAYGSPPNSANSMFLSRGFGSKTQHAPRRSDGQHQAPFHNNSGHASSQMATPQLSSGPSSNGSSPSSTAHGASYPLSSQFHPYPLSSVPGGGSGSGSGTLSASSSRVPSPLHWSRGSPTASSTASMSTFRDQREYNHHSHHYNGSGNHTHHLAQSVRMAFGMTPIYHSHPPSRRSSPPPPPVPRNTSWSASSSSSSPFHHQPLTHSAQNQQHSYSHHMLQPPASMPGSRSGSPPIHLPPLKSLPGSMIPSLEHTLEGKDAGDRSMAVDADVSGIIQKEKVELPGFSEFEAAAMGLPSLLPATTVQTTTTTSSAPSSSTVSMKSPVLGPSSLPKAIGDERMSIDFVR